MDGSFRIQNKILYALRFWGAFLCPLLCLSTVPNCLYLSPQVDSPPFAATVAAAVPLQLYHEDPVHQPLGLTRMNRPHLLSLQCAQMLFLNQQCFPQTTIQHLYHLFLHMSSHLFFLPTVLHCPQHHAHCLYIWTTVRGYSVSITFFVFPLCSPVYFLFLCPLLLFLLCTTMFFLESIAFMSTTYIHYNVMLLLFFSVH